MASSSATTPIDTSDKDVETVGAHAEPIDNVFPKPKRGTKRPVRCIPIDTDSDSPSDMPAVKVRRKGRKRPEVWDHFTLFLKNEEKRGKCNYCPTDVCGDSSSGTSAMLNHLRRCPLYPPNIDREQKLLVLHNEGSSEMIGNTIDNMFERKGKLEVWKFNQNDTRIALSKMVIMDERPFRMVEHDGFRLFMSVCCPQFVIPSRWTVARDCHKLYLDEKVNLKTYFGKLSSRICLTTDTWTSCQNLGYMSLTAHFIDKDWKLHKKIINFCPIVGHSGEVIGKSIENGLIEWGITQKILTITVDNASANDVGVEYLRRRLESWNGAVLGGKFLQMRCSAHILSLIVKEGLKEADESIIRIRNAVRFVRSSPARLKKFNNYVLKEQIESSRHLCLDVETRWNATYLMADSSLIYRKAFHKLETSDNGKFVSEMDKTLGVPKDTDWERIASLLPFLKIFYDATLRLSASLYITTNMYLQEVVGIGMMINKKRESADVGVRLMAEGMKKKHDKYWGNIDKVNILLYIAVILDPRRKLQYVKWAINQQFDVFKSEELRSLVMKTLDSLYAHYISSQPPILRTPPSEVEVCPDECENMDDWQNVVESQFERDVSSEVVNARKNDLDRYLEDAREVNSKKFEVLDWWRKHEEVYPTLALMARDVLAIPVTTVASESAFSTGGRVLDSFRSCLSSKMVEGLVCTQDWLRCGNGPLIIEECVEEVEKFDKELVDASDESTVCDDEYY